MSSPSSRTVDRVCEMGDEEFRDLLDQLVLNKPQSALVRELCADASKDEPFQSPPDVLSSLHSASSSSPAWSKSNAVAGRPGASDQQPGSSSRKSGSSSGNNNNRNRSVRSERTSESSGQEHDQNSLNSQSLQDLVSMESEGKERRKNKTTRANSFTEDGGETSRSSAGRGGSGTGKMRLRSGPPLPSTTSVNHKKAYSCNKNLSSSSTPITSSSTYSSPSSSSATTIVNASSASSSISSDPQARSSASPMKHHPSPKDTSNHRHNSSNVNKSDCDVESGRSDSSSRIFTPSLRTYSNTCHSSSNSNNYNHNNGSSSVVPVVAGSTSRTCPQTQPPPAGAHPVHVCREENLMEELENAFEMQDLRKQAEIVPISSLNGSRPPLSGPQDVDSVVHFNKLDSRSTVDPQYAELCHLGQDHGPSSGSRSAVAAYDQQQERRNAAGLNNDSDAALQSRQIIAAGSNPGRSKKSKKNREEPVLAGTLPGNIGDKDVDYLTHYVIGQEARSSAAARRDRKVTDRSKDNKKKAPERSNSQPENSSSEEKVVDKMPKGRSTSPLDRPSSPSHATSVASYAPDEFILRDEFSDDEKGYHTDQDSGFQVMIGKKRYNRHNRMSRLPANRHHFQPTRPNVVTAATPSSPTASSPSFSTAAFSVSGASASASGSVNLTSRGYESEKEFYTDNYSSRQTTIRRRKTASSMPHSQRNSPENSDVDSSLSLPLPVHRLPPPAPPVVLEDDHSGRISYAQIARSASAAAAPVPSVPTAASAPRSNNANSNNGGKGGVALSADAGKMRTQGKSAPHKSAVANGNAHPKDGPGNEGRELTAAATSPEIDTHVSVTGNQLSDTVIEVTPKSRLIPQSTTTLSTTGGDSRQQIRKHSIPETAFKSMITTKTLNRSLDSARPPPELPAVIMCDDSGTTVEQRIPNGTTPTPVTFGFFDDLVEDDKTVPASHPNGNPNVGLDQLLSNCPDPSYPAADHLVDPGEDPDVEVAEPVPAIAKTQEVGRKKELESAKSDKKGTPGPSISYPPDVDIETFNYNEILTYIRKAWESVMRTDGTVYVRSFSSGSVTTPEKTSLA